MALTKSTLEMPNWHRQIFRGAQAVDSSGGFGSMRRYLFLKSGGNSGDFSKDVDRNWSSGPAVNLIVRSPGVGLPVLSSLNLTLDHSCTHGTYWTTFSGALPDRPGSSNAVQAGSGCRVLRRFRSAILLPGRTCRSAHGHSPGTICNRPSAVVLAFIAMRVQYRSQPFCAVAAILSDCFTIGNF
jgi:hypothetical protein